MLFNVNVVHYIICNLSKRILLILLATNGLDFKTNKNQKMSIKKPTIISLSVDYFDDHLRRKFCDFVN